MEKLKQQLTEGYTSPSAEGYWQTISYCFDEISGEYLNIGVVFKDESNNTEVRMLDSFDRLSCLFDRKYNKDDLQLLFQDIEDTLLDSDGEYPQELGSDIKLGQRMYASGDSLESVVDMMFGDVVTLAKPKANQKDQKFRYQSTPKLRHFILDHMRHKLPLISDRLITQEPYLIKLPSGGKIGVDVPLLSGNSVGHIVSAWFKSPIVVENNILHAFSDLNMVLSNTDRQHASMSVLTPNKYCGLSLREFNKVKDATQKQLDRADAFGISIITHERPIDLARSTEAWWMERTG
jgi:hypothetical protein